MVHLILKGVRWITLLGSCSSSLRDTHPKSVGWILPRCLRDNPEKGSSSLVPSLLGGKTGTNNKLWQMLSFLESPSLLWWPHTFLTHIFPLFNQWQTQPVPCAGRIHATCLRQHLICLFFYYYYFKSQRLPQCINTSSEPAQALKGICQLKLACNFEILWTGGDTSAGTHLGQLQGFLQADASLLCLFSEPEVVQCSKPHLMYPTCEQLRC